MNKKHTSFYSDLIDEQINAASDLAFGDLTKKGKYNLEKFEFNIGTPELAEKIGKAQGFYTTINCSKVLPHLVEAQKYVAEEIADSLRVFFARASSKVKPKFMVIGLGNAGMVADSLGIAVTSRLVATTQIPRELSAPLGNLCFLNTGVGAVTGISSFDIIKSVSERIKPDIILAIDALVAHNPNRLGSSFQISDSGITPGAGVENFLQPLNKESLGCSVLALGVPMMISGRNLCDSVQTGLGKKIFTPKEVDLYIDKCARTIAHAINLAIHGKEYEGYR